MVSGFGFGKKRVDRVGKRTNVLLDVGLGSVAGDKGQPAVLRDRVNDLSTADIGIRPHVHIGLNSGHWGGTQVGYRVHTVQHMIAEERHEQVWV